MLINTSSGTALTSFIPLSCPTGWVSYGVWSFGPAGWFLTTLILCRHDFRVREVALCVQASLYRVRQRSWGSVRPTCLTGYARTLLPWQRRLLSCVKAPNCAGRENEYARRSQMRKSLRWRLSSGGRQSTPQRSLQMIDRLVDTGLPTRIC